jgi:hypothetical protein
MLSFNEFVKIRDEERKIKSEERLKEVLNKIRQKKMEKDNNDYQRYLTIKNEGRLNEILDKIKKNKLDRDYKEYLNYIKK